MDDNTNLTNSGTEQVTDGEAITMTKAELDTKIQAETDKRVTAALKTAKTKWDSEVGAKLDGHFKEYERKAQMTPEQLKQLDLDEKFKLLDNKEKEYARMTKEMEISKKLGEKKLSTILTKFVYADDMDVVEQNIATLEQLVMGMVNEEVEKRISSSKPKAITTTGLTKEAFQKMTIEKQTEVYKQNPTLYKQLVG